MSTRKLLGLALVVAPLFGAYTYYFTDSFSTINTTNWLQVGTVAGSGIGLTTTNTNGGSVLSKVAIPDGTVEAQLKVKFRLQSSGGNFIVYGQASDSAILGPTPDGKYRAVEMSNIVISGGSCSATLTAWDRVSGVLTNLGSTSINCWDNMELKVVMHTTAAQVFRGEDEILFASGFTFSTGKVGVGVRNAPSNNAIAQVSLGALDRTAPSAISSANVATWATPTTLSLQFPGVVDDANGVGIWRYNFYVNGTYTTSAYWPEAVLTGLTAGTTYTIGIAPQDRHWNQPTTTTLSVTMPATGTQDPRNVGVNSTTAFWGAGSENIDMRSGNLNFSLPLFKAQKRAGGGAAFGLSYNSQVWRSDGTSTYNFGRDVGYGFGWRLNLGSIVPVYSGGYTINYYLFTDSTGAEYRLTVNTGNVWTSPDVPGLSYDAGALKLYALDGTFWYMGCLSEGTEQDVGTRYPTVVQDTNGRKLS